jgi:L-fucose isomerase-like protein
MKKTTFALYFGNRGIFPGELIASARKEMIKAVTSAGCDYIILDEAATRFGGVETPAEGKIYAEFLKENEGKFNGVILSLPNFGDENGATQALQDCGVPILIQAYPDEIGRLDVTHRRDSYCGKFSITDVFCQYGIKFSTFAPHTCHPLSDEFARQIQIFAQTCRIVKGMKRVVVGGIGARVTKFKTVRFDELALQKYGITVESYDLTELFARIRKMAAARKELAAKKKTLKAYSNFSCVPAGKLDTLARMSVAIDDMVKEYGLDLIALRCWEEMQAEADIAVAPCVLMGELNNRGIAASCELDVTNGIIMRALSLGSGEPAAVLDWNNNYGNDPDKCILFHCGPVPEKLMKETGMVGNHKFFIKGGDPNCGWGTDEGRILPMEMTYASAKTENGKLYVYTGKGKITDDSIEDGFFGCGGVAQIDNLQEKILYIGKNGFRHHVSLTKGNCVAALNEAFSNYLGYDLAALDDMRIINGKTFS